MSVIDDWRPGPLDRSSRIYIAGHRGLAGSAIWRLLQRSGFTDLIGASSSELDLRDRTSTIEFVARNQPDVIVDAAARVGGILANDSYPADFLSENLQIQVNLMDAARAIGVARFLFLGSSCIYPKFADQPITEDSLLTGALEPTNEAYAIAKIAGVMQVQSVRRQDGLAWISAMPTNLYGPGDNFDVLTSHVLPALIHRFDEAARTGTNSVVLWGTGTPRREFLHVDDLASAVLFLLEHYDAPDPINVGSGTDVTILEAAMAVAETVGFAGEIVQDPSKPDGTPRKLLDVSRLTELGWSPAISLPVGLADTFKWFTKNRSVPGLERQPPATPIDGARPVTN